jgi:hypothetical protein
LLAEHGAQAAPRDRSQPYHSVVTERVEVADNGEREVSGGQAIGIFLLFWTKRGAVANPCG